MKRTYLNIFLTSLGLTLGFNLFNTAKAEPVVNRIQGNTPIEMSCNVAKETYGKEGTDCAILSSSSGFADTLSAVPLAHKYHAPILMTSKDSIDSSTAKTLKDLKVKNVYIVGGTGVLSNKIEDSIKSMDITFKRLGGQDRYETGMKIAKEMNANFNSPVVIVSGENFPDALSISPVAARNGYPILLSRQDGTNKELEDYLSLKHPSKAYIVGGTGVVSTKTESKISSYASLVKRISGIDRYVTSANVLKEFGIDEHIAVATGEDFPDALLGAVYCAKNDAKLLLANNHDNYKRDYYYDFIRRHSITLKRLTLLGSESSIDDQVGSLVSSGYPLAGETSDGRILMKRVIKFVDENGNAFKPVGPSSRALASCLSQMEPHYDLAKYPNGVHLLPLNVDSNESQLREKNSDTQVSLLSSDLKEVTTYTDKYELIPGQTIPAVDLSKDNVLQECTLKYKKVSAIDNTPGGTLDIYSDKVSDNHEDTIKFKVGDTINIRNMIFPEDTSGYIAGIDFSDTSSFKIISKNLDSESAIDDSDYRYYPCYRPICQSSYKLKAVKPGTFTVTQYIKNNEGREYKNIRTVIVVR